MEVETRPSWPDDMQAFAAGMAEGYLTKDLIYYFWKNMIEVKYSAENFNFCLLVTVISFQNNFMFPNFSLKALL